MRLLTLRQIIRQSEYTANIGLCCAAFGTEMDGAQRAKPGLTSGGLVDIVRGIVKVLVNIRINRVNALPEDSPGRFPSLRLHLFIFSGFWR